MNAIKSSALSVQCGPTVSVRPCFPVCYSNPDYKPKTLKDGASKSKLDPSVIKHSPFAKKFWEYQAPYNYTSPRNYSSPRSYSSPSAYGAGGSGPPGGGSSGGGGGGSGSGGEGSGGASGDNGRMQLFTGLLAALVAAGGGYGYVKQGSRKSLIASSAVAGVLLAAAALQGSSYATAGVVLALAASLALCWKMGGRYQATKKLMPGGIFAGVSLVYVLGYSSHLLASLV